MKNVAEKVIALSVEGLEFCEKGGSLDDFLDEISEDKSLRKIVSAVLFTYFRNKACIDYYIRLLSRGRVIPMAARTLRVAITQILYQSGIEPHAASDIAVEFAKQKKGRFTSGFVNAVLRKVSRPGFQAEAGQAMPEHVAANLPEDIFRKWKEAFTAEDFRQITASLQEEADFTFRFTGSGLSELHELEGGIRPVAAMHLNRFRFYMAVDPQKVINSDGFAKGRMYVQDPASVLAGEIIPSGRYENILDLCSAPGGKTLMLSEMFPESRITATDRSAKRLERVRENVERFHLENVTLLLADAVGYEFEKNHYDLVLADVPCSNSGVFRRRPDAIWKFSYAKLDEIVRLQSEILKKAALVLKTGGILVYSTCSIENEENHGQIESFLAGNPRFSLLKSAQLLPGPGNDGGFAAVLKKMNNDKG